MPYSIKKHEVDRLMNVAHALGWELTKESYSNGGVSVELHKELNPELLAATGELEKISEPQ
jgi:hypothetical protein